MIVEETGTTLSEGDISLILPAAGHERAADELKQEFFDHGERMIHGSALLDQLPFANWLKHTKQHRSQETAGADRVPSTTFFARRKADGRIVGMIDIRHHIDHPYLREYGGHIGYSVRPSERNQGYAVRMLGLALQYARGIGLEQVMITCRPDNLGSVKTILKHGGKLTEEKQDPNGEPMQVYWMSVSSNEKIEV